MAQKAIKKIGWKRLTGRLYVSSDNQYAVRHVDYKSWAVVKNDGRQDWEYGTWQGSVYPTLKSAMESVVQQAIREEFGIGVGA